jgi:hypothetical protein
MVTLEILPVVGAALPCAAGRSTKVPKTQKVCNVEINTRLSPERIFAL